MSPLLDGYDNIITSTGIYANIMYITFKSEGVAFTNNLLCSLEVYIFRVARTDDAYVELLYLNVSQVYFLYSVESY